MRCTAREGTFEIFPSLCALKEGKMNDSTVHTLCTIGGRVRAPGTCVYLCVRTIHQAHVSAYHQWKANRLQQWHHHPTGRQVSRPCVLGDWHQVTADWPCVGVLIPVLLILLRPRVQNRRRGDPPVRYPLGFFFFKFLFPCLQCSYSWRTLIQHFITWLSWVNHYR